MGGSVRAVVRLRVIGLAATLALICAVAASPASAAAAPGCHPDWPVVVHRAGGVAATPPAGAPRPVVCAVTTGYATSETSIAVDRAGALVFSPAETENSVARSLDDGANWSIGYPADEQATAFWNTVDPFVIADRRTGRIFWSHATGPVRNEGGLPQGAGFYLAAAYGFQVYNSDDAGKNWRTADYQFAPMGDWEKPAVGPAPSPLTGAAQPSGYPDVVYICANSPFEVIGPGRLCYKSLDGGATFSLIGYASPTPANPPDICPPLNFGVEVVDPAGALYMPVTCSQGTYVLVSRDEGQNYTWLKEPDAPTGSLTSGPYLQVAVDDAGNLYGLWPANGVLYLAVSRDGGKSWSKPAKVSAPGVAGVDRPAISAGATGNVGITYYGSADPNAQWLSAYVTQTFDALDSSPLFYSAAINDPAHPIYKDYGLTGGMPRTDFVSGAFDAAGHAFWSGVAEQLGPPDASTSLIPTVGYVGRLDFVQPTASSVKQRAAIKHRARHRRRARRARRSRHTKRRS